MVPLLHKAAIKSRRLATAVGASSGRDSSVSRRAVFHIG